MNNLNLIKITTEKKPAKCTTPKRDKMEYTLTAKDIRNLTALVTEANNILSYYICMPENKTGELEATDNDKLTALYNAIEELSITMDSVNLK